MASCHLQDFSTRLKQITIAHQPVEEKLRDVIRLCLTMYREKPAAFNFVVLNTPSFIPQLPADTVYPLDLIEQIMAAGQRKGIVRRGQPNLLAAIFLGCILRPIIVSQLADPGALDLIHNDRHDQVILDAAGDTVFPSSLALFLAIAITYFYSRLFSSRQVLRWLLLLPAIYLAADYLENVSIVTMLLSFPTSLSTLAVIANTMFMIKNLSSAVAVMTTVIGLSAWLFQRTRKLSAA